MHYDDMAVWRPLFEQEMIPLQVATGCSHNRCKFCDLYHRPFAVSPREEVAADIDELVSLVAGRIVPRVFLTGGNALAIPQDDLVYTLRRVHDELAPEQGCGCFARVTDVAAKSDQDLAELARLGLSDISIGAESGYDPALRFMDKGQTAALLIEQCARLDAAGITYDFFYLAGMAGNGKGLEAAQASAEVFNQTRPRRIMLHTMTVFAGTRLAAEIEAGNFAPATELEIMQEMRELIAGLTIPTYILGFHYGNAVHASGMLPSQREALLAAYDKAIANADEDMLERFRASMTSI